MQELSEDIRLERRIEPIVNAIPELEFDIEIRAKAAGFIGRCLVDREVDFEPSTIRPIESLHDAIHQAVAGNEDAYRMVQTNVKTDVVERTIKTGHVTKVDLMIDEAGQIQQFGQTMESIQANSLKYASSSPEILKRTEAETVNSFRIQDLYKKSELEDKCFVVFSRAADDMSIEDMKDAGFFVDTMSCAIQVTTLKNGVLETESAFVAGKKSSGDERHDKEAIEEVGKKLGVDFQGLNATELIETPVLIPKELMPNGVIDVVAMYDEASGGTFFGEDRPKEDYQEYKEKCAKREQQYTPTVNKIVQELISQAPNINSRVEAAQKLHKISEKHMVSRAVADSSIDARVFGPTAKMHIENARFHMMIGNTEQAEIFVDQAVKTAVSSSCPSALNTKSDTGIFSSEKGSDKYGSRQFKCPKGHTNTRPEGKLIENCQVCGVSVKC